MKLTRRKPKPKANPMPQESIAEPALIRPHHVRDRTLSVVAGSPKGYRVRDWPVEIAYEAGRLSTIRDDNAKGRYEAISEYNGWVDIAELRSGRDSTDLDIVSGGSGLPISQARADAIKKLVATDSRLSDKDRTIIRKLCEGWSLPGAVKLACGEDFRFAVAARVRDALDALSGAMDAARRSGYTFDMRVR